MDRLLAKAAVQPLQSGGVIGANGSNGNDYPITESKLSSFLRFVCHPCPPRRLGGGCKRQAHLWVLLLSHSLGEQPLGLLGTVLALPCDLPQECCQLFILAHSRAGRDRDSSALLASFWYFWSSSIKVYSAWCISTLTSSRDAF